MNTFDPPKLDETEKAEIGKFISETEILKAIDEQKDAKSPGEDGITCEFYKKFKGKTAPILSEIYDKTYLREELIPSMQNGIIILLYKKDDPGKLKKLASYFFTRFGL